MPPTHPAPVVRIQNLRFRYSGMPQDALWMPSLEIDRPGLVAITGPSGAGKSTLLELLAGTMNEPYSGSVQVLGKEWSELRGDRARQFHLRRIGLIPQDLGLLPGQTPRQMLRRALLDAGIAERECEPAIHRALSQMELDGYADRRIAEMSGGQKQRVAIARALVRNVDLILADEPTANLNTQLSDETIAVMKRIAQTIPVIIVTHDPRVASLCGRQVHLDPPPAHHVAPLPVARVAARMGVPALASGTSQRRVGIYSGLGAAAVVLVAALGLAGPLKPTASQSAAPKPTASAAAVAPAAVPPPAASTPAAPAAPAAATAPAKTTTTTKAKPRVVTPATQAPVTPATAAPVQVAVPAAAIAPTPVPVAVPTVVPSPTPAVPVPGSLEWWMQLSQAFGGTQKTP